MVVLRCVLDRVLEFELRLWVGAWFHYLSASIIAPLVLAPQPSKPGGAISSPDACDLPPHRSICA